MRTSLQPSGAGAEPVPGCSSCAAKAAGAKKKAPPKKPPAWTATHQAELKAALAEQRKMLLAKKAELERNDATTKANLQTYFGSDGELLRQVMISRVDKQLALNATIAKNPAAYFRDPPADEADPNRFAYVFPDDKTHKIYLDGAFRTAPVTGENSRAGTLVHEMSHFQDIAGTDDVIYGVEDALQLAKDAPGDAIKNADSFEYYLEGSR